MEDIKKQKTTIIIENEKQSFTVENSEAKSEIIMDSKEIIINANVIQE